MNRELVLVALLALTTTALAADEPKPTLVHQLGNHIKGRTYIAINDVYTLTIPDLGARNSIRIADRETRHGITAHVTLVGDNGAVAGIVTTKIRPGLPKDDQLLDHIKPRYAEMERQIGKEFQLVDPRDANPSPQKDGDDKNGRHLQFTFANEKYDEFAFPYGVSRQQAVGLKTMGIHRFLVRKGHLYEIIMILPVANNDSADAARINADKQITAMINGLAPK
jgi:hypothetical protein